MTLRHALPLLLLLLFWWAPPPVGAATADPQQLVETVTESVLARLRAQRAELEREPEKIFALIERDVLPHFDFVRISAWVLGKYWRTASREQKLRFVRAFRTILVRTYGVALLEYTDEKIRYLPLRGDPASGDVTVRTEVIHPGRAPTAINYRLHRRKGQWKVYDVTVDGVSLVANYRTSFTAEIRARGLDALIARLEAKAAQTAGGTTE